MQTLVLYAYLCPKGVHSGLYFPEVIPDSEGNPLFRLASSLFQKTNAECFLALLITD